MSFLYGLLMCTNFWTYTKGDNAEEICLSISDFEKEVTAQKNGVINSSFYLRLKSQLIDIIFFLLGYYCDALALTEPTGLCTAGFYCLTGSTTDSPNECPIGKYCPEGRWFYNYNKKVLLRERKRHTARRVLSTPSVVLPGYPPPRPDLAGGGGVSDQGTPPAGYPPSPPWLDLAGYPPPLVSAPWHSGKCCKALWDMRTPPPPPVDRQIDGRTDACQNITFPSYYVRGR